ncbi:glycosyltransferase [Metabacillus litoralis]|uniref:Glycosyl transferase family 2 n=1 Tax=Metabacillus litoralis TaxID=152268 RepID=A0A179SVM2_9BACI|nr:glycosyltransferase [Metabacillus litoralis]OAS85130.1 glycosyl transferase family 2 [Metabacillus litoralis]
MKPKISIIVPIYNVENYLGRCFDSLLTQDLKNFEIIAINDGSTDSSMKILKKYAVMDHRIVIIEKQNNGVSSARNDGISQAKGEYIGFVDPDDWIGPQMYKDMLKIAEEDHIDIVMCTYIREFGTHSKEKTFDLPERCNYFHDDVQNNIMRRLVGPLNEEVANPELLDAWGTVWSKLYRTELIRKNNIRFIDLNEIGSNEDTLFNIHASYYAKSFVFLNKPYYHYWRANNTSITSKHNPHLVSQFGKLYNRVEGFLNEKKLSDEFQLALNNRISLNTLGLGLNTISKGNSRSFIKQVNDLKNVLNNNRIKRSLDQFELKHCSMIWKTFFFFAKKRLAFGLYIMLMSIEVLRKTIR